MALKMALKVALKVALKMSLKVSPKNFPQYNEKFSTAQGPTPKYRVLKSQKNVE